MMSKYINNIKATLHSLEWNIQEIITASFLTYFYITLKISALLTELREIEIEGFDSHLGRYKALQ